MTCPAAPVTSGLAGTNHPWHGNLRWRVETWRVVRLVTNRIVQMVVPGSASSGSEVTILAGFLSLVKGRIVVPFSAV